MKRDLAILGTLIAILRKENVGLDVTNQILNGIRVAKALSIQEAIAKEAGDEPTDEEAVAELNSVETTGDYQTIVEWTVSARRLGILNRIELAADDYDLARFRLTIGGKKKWEDKELPNATTLTFPDLEIRGGRTTKLEVKSSDSSTFTAWGDITGKEVF